MSKVRIAAAGIFVGITASLFTSSTALALPAGGVNCSLLPQSCENEPKPPRPSGPLDPCKFVACPDEDPPVNDPTDPPKPPKGPRPICELIDCDNVPVLDPADPAPQPDPEPEPDNGGGNGGHDGGGNDNGNGGNGNDNGGNDNGGGNGNGGNDNGGGQNGGGQGGQPATGQQGSGKSTSSGRSSGVQGTGSVQASGQSEQEPQQLDASPVANEVLQSQPQTGQSGLSALEMILIASTVGGAAFGLGMWRKGSKETM